MTDRDLLEVIAQTAREAAKRHGEDRSAKDVLRTFAALLSRVAADADAGP